MTAPPEPARAARGRRRLRTHRFSSWSHIALSPPVHLHGLTLHSPVHVETGELLVTNCSWRDVPVLYTFLLLCAR